jgi:polyhydroxybutyrate depolymerase
MQTPRIWLSVFAASGLALVACSSRGNAGTPTTSSATGGQGAFGAGVAGSTSTTCATSGGPDSAGSTSSANGGAGGNTIGASGGNAGNAATSSGGTGGDSSAAHAGAGGAAAGGTTAASPSAGCGKAATDTPSQFVKHSLMSSGVSRDFFTYLPANYDPKKPYPTIFAFEPCGGSGNPSTNVPIQNESKDKAIIISPQSKGNCYENQIRNSPDVTLFDDTLKYAEANYCVDQARIFAMGYSAGSWMSIILGCNRADVIRAHAQVSGGLPIFIRPGVDCRGNMPALLIHDATDPTNTINGGLAARDRLLREDRCDTTTVPWDPAPCVAYQNCKPGFPVVWCETTGKGHDRQDNLAPAAMWKFFSQF